VGLEKADGGQVERNEETQPPPAIHTREDEERGDCKADDKHDHAKPEPALLFKRANVGDANIILVPIWKRAILSFQTKK